MHWWRLIPAALVLGFIVWMGVKNSKPVKWTRPERDYWETE